MSAFAIYGTGGCARDVLGPLKEMLAQTSGASTATQPTAENIVFIDDNVSMQGTRVQGVDVLSYEMAREGEYSICIAIADGKIRRAKAQAITNDGLSVFSIKAASCIGYGNITIGPGAILCDHVTLTTDVVIGAHFHANIYSYVAHDCSIGDYVTFAPRVCCNGNVTIGDGAYIGTGAVLKQGVSVGRDAVVGMGAIVTKDVAASTTVVGNPARLLKQS